MSLSHLGCVVIVVKVMRVFNVVLFINTNALPLAFNVYSIHTEQVGLM